MKNMTKILQRFMINHFLAEFLIKSSRTNINGRADLHLSIISIGHCIQIELCKNKCNNYTSYT